MAIHLLQQTDFVVFTTRDFAFASPCSLSAASKQLRRYQAKKLIQPITRGIWANTNHPYFTPLALVPLLIGKDQGYVSFLTSLHTHGLLSQIPTSYHVATTAHPRKLKTPVGTFEFHRLQPKLMLEGIEWSQTPLPYRTASPEKALLDLFYLATRRGRRFASLPELEHTPTFNSRRFKHLAQQLISDKRIRSAVLTRLEKTSFI